MTANLIVISGGSGTGKSTLCRALQEALLPDVWLHLSVDTILYCLPQTILDRANQKNDWSSVDIQLTCSTAYACVNVLLSAGHKVIFDCVVLTEKRADAMLSAFKEHRPILVGLSCSWEEIRRRTLERGDRTLEEAEYGFLNAGKYLAHHYTFETTSMPSEVIASQLARRLRAGTSDALVDNG
jgi:chloramphenicol 3-O phosphotransferase